jgi:hypothetical protein
MRASDKLRLLQVRLEDDVVDCAACGNQPQRWSAGRETRTLVDDCSRPARVDDGGHVDCSRG